MRRIVPLLLLVLLAGALAFSGIWSDDDEAEQLRLDRVQHIEELIRVPDLEGARRAVERAQGMNAAEIAYGKAIVAFSSGLSEEALAHAREARALAPNAWRPITVEVGALAQLGREAEVGRAVLAALEAMPDDERVLAMAAQYFAESPTDRDPYRARLLLEQIEALPVRKALPGDATAVTEQSLLRIRYSTALATGAYASARIAAQKLIVASSGDPITYAWAAEAARRAGDTVDAIESYRRAVQLAPTQRTWHENLVQILLAVPGAEGEALERTSGMLRTWPAERSVRVLRARALVRSEKTTPDAPDRAVAIYRRLLTENPDDLEVLRNLAVLLYDWKQGGQDGTYLDEAHALLQRYLLRGGVIDDTLGDTWLTLHRRAAEIAAQSDLTTTPEHAAFERAPGDAVAAEEYRALLLNAGRAEEAGAVVRRALAAAPDDAGVNALAARHFLAQGPDHDPASTLHHLEIVAEALGGPDRLSESLLWVRCRALLLVHRASEAFADAQKLLAARPTAAPYLETAACAALALGKDSEAEEWLRAALVHEDRPELRELLERAIGDRAE